MRILGCREGCWHKGPGECLSARHLPMALWLAKNGAGYGGAYRLVLARWMRRYKRSMTPEEVQAFDRRFLCRHPEFYGVAMREPYHWLGAHFDTTLKEINRHHEADRIIPLFGRSSRRSCACSWPRDGLLTGRPRKHRPETLKRRIEAAKAGQCPPG